MNEEEVITFLRKNPWKFYKISILTENKARSYRQVKYYFWLLVKLISDHTWYTSFDINEINKGLCQKETFTDLDTKEFEKKMSFLRQYYNYHLKLNIPKPNENIFFYD